MQTLTDLQPMGYNRLDNRVPVSGYRLREIVVLERDGLRMQV